MLLTRTLQQAVDTVQVQSTGGARHNRAPGPGLRLSADRVRRLIRDRVALLANFSIRRAQSGVP